MRALPVVGTASASGTD